MGDSPTSVNMLSISDTISYVQAKATVNQIELCVFRATMISTSPNHR